MADYDVIIVGGGPGGYPAAVRLASEGLRVALVEERLLGGECTNYGCIPSKAVLKAARISLESRRHSWLEVTIHGRRALEWARSVAASVRGGLERLLRGAGVEIVRSRATRLNGRCVSLATGGTLCASRAVVLATGSSPRRLPGLEPDGKYVLDNRSLFALEEPPDSLLIVGGGYIGVEAAFAFSLMGSRVTLVELMPRLLPAMERGASLAAARSLAKAGVRILTSARVESLERTGDAVRAHIVVSGREETVEASRVLVAIGREPNISLSGLEESGVRLSDKGFIVADCSMRAGPGIYAAGDVTGPPLLAHKAIVESLVAAENILGRKRCVSDYTPIPETVFISPEIVRVFSSRKPSTMYRVRVDALARSRIEGEGGFVEFYVDSDRRLVGAILVYEGASEHAGLVAELVRRGATLEEAATIVYPHPTLSEALAEAAHFGLGAPVHVLSGVKRRIGGRP